MRIKLLLTLLLCLALPSLAQTGVKGTVVDSRSGKPIADANILLRGQSVFVVSGADGQFTISNAEPGQAQLEIVAYGYDDYAQDVEIVSGIVRELGKISLTPQFNAVNLLPDDQNLDDETVLDDEGLSQSIGTIQ